MNPMDGDVVRGKGCGNWLEEDDGFEQVVGVVWTIVDDALRTFDVLNVRVTITGVIEFVESIEQRKKSTVEETSFRSIFTRIICWIGVYCRWFGIEECLLERERETNPFVELSTNIDFKEDKYHSSCMHLFPHATAKKSFTYVFDSH